MKTNILKIKQFGLLLASLICFLEAEAQVNSRWQCDVYSFEYDMTVYFSLQQEGLAVSDYSSYEVAAFVGNECRGVAEFLSIPIDGKTDTQCGYLRVRSNLTEGEVVTFRAYQPSTEKNFEINEQLTFERLGISGMPSAPFVMTLVEVIKGDVNGDRIVDEADIAEVVNCIMGSPSEKFNSGAADLNGDNKINATDIVLIVNEMTR